MTELDDIQFHIDNTCILDTPDTYNVEEELEDSDTEKPKFDFPQGENCGINEDVEPNEAENKEDDPEVEDEETQEVENKEDAREVEDDEIEDEETGAGKRKRKTTRYFTYYLSKIVKNIYPEGALTSDARKQINSILILLAEKIAFFTHKITVNITNKKTISIKSIEGALKLNFEGDLRKHAIAEGYKAIQILSNYTSTDVEIPSEERKKYISRQEKAQIIFPPAILEKFLREFNFSKIFLAKDVALFFAASLEYIAMEIIASSIFQVKEENRVRITVRDIEIGCKKDEELRILLSKNNIQFLGGGVIPFIHPFLANKKPIYKKKIKPDSDGDIKKAHRFKPGTVSLREIKKFQKMGNTLLFARLPFTNLVYEIVHGFKPKQKIAKLSAMILQYITENYIVKLLTDANLVAIHAGRFRLLPSDIDFTRSLLENKSSYLSQETISVIKLKDLTLEETEEEPEETEEVEEVEEEADVAEAEAEEELEEVEEDINKEIKSKRNKSKSNLSVSSITKLARRASVKSMALDCFDLIRSIIKIHLGELIDAILVITEQKAFKIMAPDDIFAALPLIGINVAKTDEF